MKMLPLLLCCFLISPFSSAQTAPGTGLVLGSIPGSVQGSVSIGGNHKIANFGQAKKMALKLHEAHPVTIYCPCKYSGKTIDLQSCNYHAHKDPKRATRLEWEHVVAAENFGHSFVEWREGAPQCKKKNGRRFKGRKCAETNADFNHMEADLYNLWPIIGELNGLRNNFTMEQIEGEPEISFGGCAAKIKGRKFEPMDIDKGVVARVHLYMDQVYPGHGVISDKNKKLFEAWDKKFPVTTWECERADKIKMLQGNVNPILESRCHPVKN